MIDITDNKELRKLLLSWSDKSVAHLYYHCFKALLKISIARTHDLDASKDIAQDALVRLYEKSDSILKDEKFMIWNYVVTIVTNNSKKHYNKSLRHDRPDMDELSADFKEYVLEVEKFLRSRNKTIWRIVATLPPDECECLTKKFYEQKTNEAVARELGISVKAVEARVTKSFKTLRQYRHLIY